MASRRYQTSGPPHHLDSGSPVFAAARRPLTPPGCAQNTARILLVERHLNRCARGLQRNPRSPQSGTQSLSARPSLTSPQLRWRHPRAYPSAARSPVLETPNPVQATRRGPARLHSASFNTTPLPGSRFLKSSLFRSARPLLERTAQRHHRGRSNFPQSPNGPGGQLQGPRTPQRSLRAPAPAGVPPAMVAPSSPEGKARAART